MPELVARLASENAKTLTRWKDAFISSGSAQAQRALKDAHAKKELVAGIAGLLAGPNVPVTVKAAETALREARSLLTQAEATGLTRERPALAQRVSELENTQSRLRQAWRVSGPDLITRLPEALRPAVQAYTRSGRPLRLNEDRTVELVAQLAGLPFALLEDLERALRPAAPGAVSRAHPKSRKRADILRTLLGLLTHAPHAARVQTPTRARDAKARAEALERFLPQASGPERAKLQGEVARLRRAETLLSKSEADLRAWRFDVGGSWVPLRSWGPASLVRLGLNLETHLSPAGTRRYLTLYANAPAATPVASAGISLPLKGLRPLLREAVPTAQAGGPGMRFGWGRWGPRMELTFDDGSFTTEGGDMVGFAVGADVAQRLTGRDLSGLKPNVPGLGQISPSVGLYRHEPLLADTRLGAAFRAISRWGNRTTRALEDAAYGTLQRARARLARFKVASTREPVSVSPKTWSLSRRSA